jgi:glycosyltransferase involved in cell wall biosynthesis
LFSEPDPEKIRSIGYQPYSYSMVIARMEPENNIETIIKGYLLSGHKNPLLLIGSTANKYGRQLKENYEGDKIRFLGPLYDIEVLNNMRHFSHFYFHGHSVGGTNPSLLEAMASQCLILAHSNIFNRSVLHEDAYYFNKEEDIAQVLNEVPDKIAHMDMILRNTEKIVRQYTWDHIVDSLENHLTDAVRNFREKKQLLA